MFHMRFKTSPAAPPSQQSSHPSFAEQVAVDSRKRGAGSDSDFEVDQSDARLAVYKIRIADSFLSTDRGWVDAALGTLNWALLPEGAYTGCSLDQLQPLLLRR